MINAKYVDGLELRINELNKKLSNEADEALHLIAENNSLKDERDSLVEQVEALRQELCSVVDWFSAYWPDLTIEQKERLMAGAKTVAHGNHTTNPQQHLAEIRAEAAKAALLKLADEYRPFGLRHSYTAFDVANHVSAQAEYYADSIRQEKYHEQAAD